MGFAVLYGLTEGALIEARQASSLMEAANLAQKEMDQLSAHSWKENINRQACIPGGIVEGSEGNYHWFIRSDWDDLPQLLRVSVEVRWIERGAQAWYRLESLYDVE